MIKTLTAGLMALTLTFTSATSTQAQGLSEDDVGKLLFGLLATAAIAHAIKENRSDRNDRNEWTEQRRAPEARRSDVRPRGVVRHQSQPRNRVDHTVLPRQCIRSFETRRGEQRLMVRRCLERNYARAASLPNQCAVRIRTDRGQRNGYNPRCLRQMGYSISRH